MYLVRGLFALGGLVLVLVLGGIIVMLVAWIPVEVKGIGLGPWVAHYMARSVMRFFRADVTAPDYKMIQNLQGYVFANHTTYMDIIALLCVSPVRFVGKAEIRRWPLIGQIAIAIGCVFVQRESRTSRKQTRSALVDIHHRPPIVLFPEGKTAPIGKLLEFRRGAFEIACQGNDAYALCAIVYSQPELVNWKTRSAVIALWDMFSRPGRLKVDVHLVDVVTPKDGDDPAILCDTAYHQMLETLTTQGNYSA